MGTCKSFDFTHPNDKPMVITPKGKLAKSGGVPICSVRNVGDTSPSDLAALFAVYGNVVYVRVKPERNVAIIQMQDALQCAVAQMNLQNVPVHGRHIEIEVGSQRSADWRSGP